MNNVTLLILFNIIMIFLSYYFNKYINIIFVFVFIILITVYIRLHYNKIIEGNNNNKDNELLELMKINTLLDKLMNIFGSKQQDCKGQFKQFGPCKPPCGLGKQEVKYEIIQEKGEYGIDCRYEDGFIKEIDCINKLCEDGDKCNSSFDCEDGYCDSTSKKCVVESKCGSEENLVFCLSEDECMGLNKRYNTKDYEWDRRNSVCFRKSNDEVTDLYEDWKENLNLNWLSS